MFIFLSKFLPDWIYPIGLTVVLLVLIIILARYARVTRILAIAALAVLFLSGNRWVSYSLARSLEWRYLPPAQTPHAEVIVLLGGGTLAADYPRPTVELNSAGDRVLYAVQLYRQGLARTILISGGYIPWLNDNPISPADDMADLMTGMGVAREDIWLQSQSQNTYEDALYCAEMLRERGIDRALLVTSAMHMPRSVALFEKQGIEVVPMPTDYSITERNWAELTRSSLLEQFVNLVPSVNDVALTTASLKEYIGMMAYRLRGWM